jgi:hypothetical protein
MIEPKGMFYLPKLSGMGCQTLFITLKFPFSVFYVFPIAMIRKLQKKLNLNHFTARSIVYSLINDSGAHL